MGVPSDLLPAHRHRDVAGGSFRAAVFGVSDGLVSNVSLIIGVAGAEAASYSAVRDMVASQDFIEGPRAFAEKRAPNWKGA